MKGFKFLLCAVLTMAASQVFAEPDIVGKYTCSGSSMDGSNSYTQPLVVSKRGDGYSFQWLNSDTEFPQYLGTGLYNPNVPNAIAVAYQDAKDQKSAAVTFYQIKSDGSLHGFWMYIGNKTGGKEDCTKSEGAK